MFLLDIPEPTNCAECIFCDAERGFCYISTTDGTLKTTKNVTEYADHDHCTKPEWCPASRKFEEVYLITSREYSDYSIHAVTVSKEKAEKLQKYYSNRWYGSSPAEIETLYIDEPHENLDDLIPVYCVSIDRRGKCFCKHMTWMHEKTGKLIEDAPSYLTSCLGSELVTEHGLFGDDFLTFRWYGAAKDEEHALKIAQDKRAKMLEQYYMDKGENE